ncbi:hypothetical protein GQS52_16620 [Streptomyces sp. SCUT-3]|uniref:hypothetical protein n=1 Tax=Streptomyces TaxID=1883 RepID=UPI000CBC1664|nr:hypothetical protein [Streptomyces sp. SCUT-3]PLW72812.1 hypothetical protein C0036_10595 [Streptomyces sp. DJ]QMV23127.1 hypothetical protein GQS52_16620 [Streptomyces sp. SCUT-3]
MFGIDPWAIGCLLVLLGLGMLGFRRFRRRAAVGRLAAPQPGRPQSQPGRPRLTVAAELAGIAGLVIAVVALIKS